VYDYWQDQPDKNKHITILNAITLILSVNHSEELCTS